MAAAREREEKDPQGQHPPGSHPEPKPTEAELAAKADAEMREQYRSIWNEIFADVNKAVAKRLQKCSKKGVPLELAAGATCHGLINVMVNVMSLVVANGGDRDENLAVILVKLREQYDKYVPATPIEADGFSTDAADALAYAIAPIKTDGDGTITQGHARAEAAGLTDKAH